MLTDSILEFSIFAMGAELEKLLGKVRQYEREGVLEKSAADALSERLSAEIAEGAQKKRSVERLAVFIVGVLVVCFAAYYFVWGIWEHMGLAQRTLVAFAPLGVSAAVGAYVLAKGSPKVYKEIASLLNILGIVCLLFIGFRIYNIDVQSNSLFFFSFCAAAPLIFIFDSTFALIFCAAMYAAAFSHVRGFVLGGLTAPAFIFFACALLLVVLKRSKAACSRAVSLSHLAVCLFLSVVFVAEINGVLGCGNFYLHVPLWGMVSGIMALFAAAYPKWRSPVTVFALVLFYVAVGRIFVKGEFFIRQSEALSQLENFNLLWYAVAVLILLLLYARYFHVSLKLGSVARVLRGLSLVFVLVPLCVLSAYFSPAYAGWVTFGIFGALFVWALYEGASASSYADLNTALAYLSALALSRTFWGGITPLETSAMLAALGVVVISTNAFVFSRRQKCGLSR